MWQDHLRDVGFVETELLKEATIALQDIRSVTGGNANAYFEFLSRFGEQLYNAPFVVSHWPRTNEWVEITEWFGLRAPTALITEEWRLGQDRLPERLLPIGRDPGGARFCLDLHTGRIWFVCDDLFPFNVNDTDRFRHALAQAGVDAKRWEDTRVALEYRMSIEHLSFDVALSPWGDVIADDFATFAANLRPQVF